MANVIKKIKSSFKGINWPKPKDVVSDTTFSVVTTAILSLLVYLWINGIDIIVEMVASWF